MSLGCKPNGAFVSVVSGTRHLLSGGPIPFQRNAHHPGETSGCVIHTLYTPTTNVFRLNWFEESLVQLTWCRPFHWLKEQYILRITNRQALESLAREIDRLEADISDPALFSAATDPTKACSRLEAYRHRLSDLQVRANEKWS